MPRFAITRTKSTRDCITSRGVNAPAIASGDQSLVCPTRWIAGNRPPSRALILGTNPTAYVRTLARGRAKLLASPSTRPVAVARSRSPARSRCRRRSPPGSECSTPLCSTPASASTTSACSGSRDDPPPDCRSGALLVAGTGLIAGVLALPAGVTVHQNVIEPARSSAPPASRSPPASKTCTAPGNSQRSQSPDCSSPSPARSCQPPGWRSYAQPRRCEPK